MSMVKLITSKSYFNSIYCVFRLLDFWRSCRHPANTRWQSFQLNSSYTRKRQTDQEYRRGWRRAEKNRHRKREWEIQGLVSHCNAHWQANSVDNVSVTERSNHSVLSQNQSPRICTLAKGWDVYSKQLKETYKERVSRQANLVTFLPLSPTVSSARSRKCRGIDREKRKRRRRGEK